MGGTHPKRDLQTFDDPRIDMLIDQCRERRIAGDISQREIAEKAGCSLRAVTSLEAHQQMPSLSLFVRYANACGFVLVLAEYR